MNSVAYRPLTVAFHEAGFAERLNAERAMGLPFQQDEQARADAGSPWGPQQPTSLNRYAYVLNNPERWTDPSGHDVRYTKVSDRVVLFYGGSVRNESSHAVYVTGDIPLYNPDGTYKTDPTTGELMFTTVKIRVEPGKSTRDYGMVDADFIEPIDTSVDGYSAGDHMMYKLPDMTEVTLIDDIEGTGVSSYKKPAQRLAEARGKGG